MRNILYSVLGKKDSIYIESIKLFFEECDNLSKEFKVKGLITDKEREYLNYIVKSYEDSGETPSVGLFTKVFPETEGSISGSSCTLIDVNDLRVYIFSLVDNRLNKYSHDKLSQLNEAVRENGITDEISEEFETLKRLSNRNKARDISIDINAKSVYDDMKKRPEGLQTGIKAIDDKIGGMSPGTVTTIAGFTSQYKTTMAVNIARLNAYYLGYNIVYISLETPKQDMNWNLLSCHSYDTKFPKYNFISHDRMRHCKLTLEEEDYLFNTIEKDFKEPLDDNGNPRTVGRVVFLDESDFNTFSFGEITAVLEKVDDELIKDNGYGIDAVIVDYVQLCKFSGSGMTTDANAQINSYVTFFRRLGQNFRKVRDENGNEQVKQLAIILLAQLNRGGWQKAVRNEGKYDLTALADANELERGSARIFTTYTNEDLKARKSAQVQILKNRAGETMYDPEMVYADGEAYVFCDESGMNSSIGSFDGSASLDAAFSDFNFGDLSSLGI